MDEKKRSRRMRKHISGTTEPALKVLAVVTAAAAVASAFERARSFHQEM